MIHHVSFGTNNVSDARKFYVPVMEVLGLKIIHENENSLDFGAQNLEISLETPINGKPATAGNGTHIAFAVETRKDVDLFYQVAMQNGGHDAGEPGLRPEYDDNYYGAFVFDPDGNKLEAVTFYSK